MAAVPQRRKKHIPNLLVPHLSIHRMIYQSVRLLQISNQLEEQMNSNLAALFVLFYVGISNGFVPFPLNNNNNASAPNTIRDGLGVRETLSQPLITVTINEIERSRCENNVSEPAAMRASERASEREYLM